MSSIEKISVALPPEILASVREAVATGEYTSSSEVICEALSDWSHKRQLLPASVHHLREIWEQARTDQAPGLPVDEVMKRLETKYRIAASASDVT